MLAGENATERCVYYALYMQTLQKRLVWADFLRVLAITAVVAIHTLDVSLQSHWVMVGLFAALKTAVPVFVMLSGALLLPRELPPLQFFERRMQRVVLP